MNKILVVAEKPSVAADYAKALGQYKPQDGYYEGDKYVITWAIGHIVSRKELYEYDPHINRSAQNREHVLSTLPYFPQEHILKLSTINTQYMTDKNMVARAKAHNKGLLAREAVFKQLFSRTDISYIVNGCDAGREGEAIFNQIYEFFNCTFPIKRLWISSNITSDIIKGFENLKDGSEYYNLKQASYARAEMDWEHGLNLSALYASLYGAPLSLGRVQTPVLNMIVEREKEIQQFTPEDYFLIEAQFSTEDNFKYKGRMVIDDSLGNIVVDGKIKNIADANNIINFLNGKPGYIKSIENNKRKESPKLLYNLSELQKEMNAKHKMTSTETLNIAQSLYETHKLTTYPRTSSQYLNTTMRDDAFNRLDYLPKDFDRAVAMAKEHGACMDKVFNDKKVEDHYAIIPTVNSRHYDLSKLSPKEKIVFMAIVKRYLSIFLPVHEYESTVLTTAVGQYNFKTTGKKITKVGWKMLYMDMSEEEDNDDSKEDNQDLTYSFTENLAVSCLQPNLKSKKTQPPKRYTDGTLIDAMEVGGVKNANITDPEKLDILKEKGLGTSATRASIIENIITRGYVMRDKKTSLIPTEKGIDFIKIIKVDLLKSPEITGEWEHKLKLVEKGKLNKDTLISEVRMFITECVEKAKESYSDEDRIASGTSIGAKCPICNSDVIKNQKAYFCSNNHKGCKFVIFSNICGKTLTDTHIKDLCSKGITKVIKGFSNPNKKDENGKPVKFDSCLVYNKDTQKVQFGGKNGTTGPKERKETDYICPVCGKPIVEFETGYGCSGYKDGCSFSFFKNVFNKKLAPTDISDLLNNRETKIFKDVFNPKYPQKKFCAKVILKDGVVSVIKLNENGEVDEGKPTAHFCPVCNNSMLEFAGYHKCSKCNFMISKKIAGVDINDSIVKSICVDKKSDYLEFTSNQQKKFKARLILNEKSKKLEFQMYTTASQYSCPLCKSEIGDAGSNYKCTNPKCNLTVWKKFGSVPIEEASIKELFEKKQTSDYLDLVSAKGNPFKAKLVINTKTKKVELMFAPKEK